MSPKREIAGPKVTLGEMVLSGGWINTRKAIRFASRYGMACKVLKHPPTMYEYADFHGISRAQAYRDWSAWRSCVGDRSVLEVVSDEALAKRGMTEEDREAAIARWLSE